MNQADTERYGLAVLRALDEADKALTRGNAPMMRYAVKVACQFIPQCAPEVRDLVLHRMAALARRCPASQERDELLARANAMIGPTGTA